MWSNWNLKFEIVLGIVQTWVLKDLIVEKSVLEILGGLNTTGIHNGIGNPIKYIGTEGL